MIYVIQVLLTACERDHDGVLLQKKIEKIVHPVGFIISVYHDARSPERQSYTNH